MKILIDARMYGLENAGIGRYVMGLVDNLNRIDNKNRYVVILRKKYFDSLILNKNWEKYEFDERHYSFNEQIKFPKILNKISADLVHFPHFNVPIGYRGKFVVTIHDMLMHRQKGSEATTLNPVLYRIKRFGYHKIFSNAVVRSQKIFVPSKYVRDDLLKRYKVAEDKIRVIYEGVEHNDLSSKRGKYVERKYQINKKYFVYTGSAYPHKNLKRLIEAVSLLNEELGDENRESINLIIISARNVFTKRIERIADQFKMKDEVKLLGFVPDRELASIYKNSLGFVYPSLHEGFGLPGLEAMASGTLALVSDIPVFKEIYQNRAIYFNPYDFTSIKKTLRDAIDMDISERREIIKDGQKFVGRYSWEKMARETKDVYEEVHISL